MKASVSKKSFVLAMAIGLLGVSMPEFGSAEARPPRGRPTSPVGTRMVKGIKNFLKLRTPSHRRPQPPAAAAAVGQRSAGSRRNVRRLDSRGRVVRGGSRPSLHGSSRSASRRNLRRPSSRNVRNQYESADARIWTSVPPNAAVSTYGQAPAGPGAAPSNTVATYGRAPTGPGAPNTVGTYGQAPGPGLPPSGYVAPPPLPGRAQPRPAHGQLPVRMPTNSAPRGQ